MHSTIVQPPPSSSSCYFRTSTVPYCSATSPHLLSFSLSHSPNPTYSCSRVLAISSSSLEIFEFLQVLHRIDTIQAGISFPQLFPVPHPTRLASSSSFALFCSCSRSTRPLCLPSRVRPLREPAYVMRTLPLSGLRHRGIYTGISVLPALTHSSSHVATTRSPAIIRHQQREYRL